MVGEEKAPKFGVSVKETSTYLILNVDLNTPITPEDVPDILREAGKVDKPKAILIISGRMPLWLAGALVHHFCHLHKVVALYDPKISGAVVVSSHVAHYREGDVVYPEVI